MSMDVGGGSGPGTGVSPGVVWGPGDEGRGRAVEVNGKPGTA